MYPEVHFQQLVVNPLLIVILGNHVFLGLVIIQEINAKMFLFVITETHLQYTTTVSLIEIVLMITSVLLLSVSTISV